METHNEEINFDLADIDWFCSINGLLIHVASNGGRLPRNLSNSPEELYRLKQLAFSAEANFSYGIDTDFSNNQAGYEYLEDIPSETRNQFLKPPTYANKNIKFNSRLTDIGRAYSWSFIEMAQRGFYSFDRVDKDEYHLVAWPSRKNRWSDYYSFFEHLINQQFPQIITDYFPKVRGLSLFYKNHLPWYFPHKIRLIDIIESGSIETSTALYNS